MVSNSPKQWLHDTFANHIDCKKTTTTDNSNEQVKQLRFHCQCDHLVVENPFIAAAVPINILIPFFYGQYITTDYHFTKTNHQSLPALRGPPQFIL